MPSGDKARRPVDNRKAMLDAGIERLRAGRLADPWVCREFLGLDGDPDPEEIIRAVHEHIHVARKIGLTTLDGEKEARAAIIAGSVALIAKG